jgi:hypothetical protein
MTIRSRHRNQSVPANAEQARYAIEALFQPQRPGGETADVDVVVKRRRIAPSDDRVSGKDDAQVLADEVRAPRVFQVERQPEGQESLSEARLDGQPRLSSSAVTQVKRRRRRLNGEVTIIRPPSQALGEGSSSKKGRQLTTMAGSVSPWRLNVDMRSYWRGSRSWNAKQIKPEMQKQRPPFGG